MIALNTVVHNEADRIVGLLEHASGYCGELIVVNQDSTDDTADLASDFGAFVFDDRCRDVQESRLWASSLTRSEWILVLDADEYLTDAAIEALPKIMAEYDGARFARLNTIDGIQTVFSPDYQFRFFKKGTVTFDKGWHGRIVPHSDRTFTVEKWGIIHAKTRAEQDLDDANYRVPSGA